MITVEQISERIIEQPDFIELYNDRSRIGRIVHMIRTNPDSLAFVWKFAKK